MTGRVAASFESDNGRYFEGHIGTSLNDTTAIRIAAVNRQIDGYLDNSDLGHPRPMHPLRTRPLPGSA